MNKAMMRDIQSDMVKVDKLLQFYSTPKQQIALNKLRKLLEIQYIRSS